MTERMLRSSVEDDGSSLGPPLVIWRKTLVMMRAKVLQVLAMGRSQEAKRRSIAQPVGLFPAPAWGERVHPMLAMAREGTSSHGHRTANWCIFTVACPDVEEPIFLTLWRFANMSVHRQDCIKSRA